MTVSATAANADIVYNDLDGVIDTTHESMTLYLNPGTPGTTELRILQEGMPDDHPNCNIQGDPWNLTVDADYDASVVSVEFPSGTTFADCDSVLQVEVTPLTLGSTSVVFDYTANVPSGNDNRTFDASQADFDVTVEEGTGGGGGTVCDADPAAPAWAAALLKGNGVKAKGTTWSNYVSSVANDMGQRATFDGVEKSDHPDYENAVWDYMKSELGLTLQKGPHHPDVIKPGWECTAIPGSAS